jgi:hypothetical protein
MAMAENIQTNSTEEVACADAEEIILKVDRHGLARYSETRMIILD